jgi:UDP-N-acetylmuramoyl-L-alanyl-D-glutamate--2,6-diaminopimelate ligase
MREFRGIALRELFARIPVEGTVGSMDARVNGIAYDSREVTRGQLFVAMDGRHADGHSFIPMAVKNGAAAVMHGRPVPQASDGVTYVRVKDPRALLSSVASAYFRDPSRSIRVIGVTGTDGKSSTVWFIAQLLGMLGKKVGFLSTVSFQTGENVVKNPFRQSTPEATEIQGMLRDMVDTGKEFAVVEATSHGLSAKTNRLGDVLFDAAVLTNVTHEHLEFHGSFEQYRSDKANLFRFVSPDTAKSDPRTGTAIDCRRFCVVNADDPSAEYFRHSARVPVRSYGISNQADLSVQALRGEIAGTTFLMASEGRETEVRIAIPGPFWVENALAACLAVSGILDRDPLSLAPFIGKLRGVKGRMEIVDLGQPFSVIVDYAHTPGAFQKLFPWVRGHAAGKIIVVFGSAGERDTEKRPMQGRIAAEHCDVVVITDEDPRGEDRMSILEQIAAGCAGKRRGEDLFIVPDRTEAMLLAFQRAGPGDVVLLLGKGHEASIIGPTGPAEWDERTEAEKALRSLGHGA